MKIIKIGVIGYDNLFMLNEEEKELLPPTVVYAISIAEHELRIKYGDDIKFEMIAGQYDGGVNRAAFDYAKSPARKDIYVKTTGVTCNRDTRLPICTDVDELRKFECYGAGNTSRHFMEQIDALVRVGGKPHVDKSSVSYFLRVHPNGVLVDFPYPIPKV